MYLARGGCTCRMLPHDFPLWKTVSYYIYAWRDDGTWDRVHAALRAEVRHTAGREPIPSAGIIDSQSLKTTEAGRGATTGEKGRSGSCGTRSLTRWGWSGASASRPPTWRTARGAGGEQGPVDATVGDSAYGRLVAFAWVLLDLTVEVVTRREGRSGSRSFRGSGWSSGRSRS